MQGTPTPSNFRFSTRQIIHSAYCSISLPCSIPIDFGKKAPEIKDMTWVKVVGKMSYKKEGNQTVPIIEATQVEETTAPDNAMIY